MCFLRTLALNTNLRPKKWVPLLFEETGHPKKFLSRVRVSNIIDTRTSSSNLAKIPVFKNSDKSGIFIDF